MQQVCFLGNRSNNYMQDISFTYRKLTYVSINAKEIAHEDKMVGQR